MHVLVYNPLGTNKSRIVRLPVSVNATFDVERIDSNGRATTTQSIPSIPDNLDRPVSSSAAKYVLAFDTGPLVPVGVNVFKSNNQQPFPANPLQRSLVLLQSLVIWIPALAPLMILALSRCRMV